MYVEGIAIAILIGSFLLLILFKMPISISLAISSVLTTYYIGIPVSAVIQRMVNGINQVALLAIPFFIFAGQLMSEGGISQKLVNFSRVLVGRVRGGLAMVNVLTSMFFGGISGSAVADTSSVGSIMIPIMKKDGYDADFATSVTIASATQGILIPPSHNMVIYALAAGGGVSIGMLFIGGLVPGVILGISQMIISYIIAVKRNYPKGKPIGLKDSLKIIKDALLGLFTPVIIVGGVLTGIFTATESAAVATLWAFIVSVFFYQELNIRKMKFVFKKTLDTLIIVLPLIATANAFGWLLALLKVPTLASDFLIGLTDNRIIILLLINIILLVLGLIMDMAPLILICTPVLLPVALSIGMHPVHFGIVMMLNLGIGLMTPPVGVTLFVGSTIGGVSVEKLFKSTLPFYAVMIVVLLLITYVPAIVMTIPNMVFN